MDAVTLTFDEMMALRPCKQRLPDVIAALGDAKTWNGKKIDAAQAVAAGVPLDDLIWVASALAKKDKGVERNLRMWMTDCAAHVLPIFERESPHDSRPRQAIQAGRDVANGLAARAAASDAASDAARAAASAAWATARAARAAARAAAWAAASDAEKKFQTERFVAWFSAQEPEPWPIGETAKEGAA